MIFFKIAVLSNFKRGVQCIKHLEFYRKYCKIISPSLTSERYSHLKRKEFTELSQTDIEEFKKFLPDDGQIIQDSDDLREYNVDWLQIYRGNSKVVLRPKTVSQVSSIVSYCNDKCIAVTPQGGNTSLVGGSVPVFDEVIISMKLMNKVINIDPVANVLICEAGCILEQVDTILAEHDLIMPLDLGAKGSCHIGGNVATNAGGIHFLRYGSLHGSVLGLEVVLADGTVLDSLSSIRKDNTGYDLKQLFIGSEGTLGIITKVSIVCPSKPLSQNVAFFGCESFNHVLSLLASARKHLGESLSAFEFMDEVSIQSVTETLKMTNPLEIYPFYVLVETSGANETHDEEKMNIFLDLVMHKELVLNGIVTSELSKMKNIWLLRESIAQGLTREGYCYKYDISLPLSQYYRIVEIMRDRLIDENGVLRVCGYGHVGDCNLHLNIVSKEYSKAISSNIEPYIYEFVSENTGSISAEHGLGVMKNRYIHYSQSPVSIKLMSQIKTMFDPKGILNPYKTLP